MFTCSHDFFFFLDLRFIMSVFLFGVLLLFMMYDYIAAVTLGSFLSTSYITHSIMLLSLQVGCLL